MTREKEAASMPSKLYEQLSHEGKVLVDQAMERLDP